MLLMIVLVLIAATAGAFYREGVYRSYSVRWGIGVLLVLLLLLLLKHAPYLLM